jgi:hypothetical protein
MQQLELERSRSTQTAVDTEKIDEGHYVALLQMKEEMEQGKARRTG